VSCLRPATCFFDIVDADVKWFPLDFIEVIDGLPMLYVVPRSAAHMIDSSIVISRSGFILSHSILYYIVMSELTGPMTPRHHTTPVIPLSLPGKYGGLQHITSHLHTAATDHTHSSTTETALSPLTTYSCPSQIIRDHPQWRVTRILGPCPMAGSHSKARTFTKYVHRLLKDSTKATKHGST
jgi:hypothetical protein